MSTSQSKPSDHIDPAKSSKIPSLHLVSTSLLLSAGAFLPFISSSLILTLSPPRSMSELQIGKHKNSQLHFLLLINMCRYVILLSSFFFFPIPVSRFNITNSSLSFDAVMNGSTANQKRYKSMYHKVFPITSMMITAISAAARK